MRKLLMTIMASLLCGAAGTADAEEICNLTPQFCASVAPGNAGKQFCQYLVRAQSLPIETLPVTSPIPGMRFEFERASYATQGVYPYVSIHYIEYYDFNDQSWKSKYRVRYYNEQTSEFYTDLTLDQAKNVGNGLTYIISNLDPNILRAIGAIDIGNATIRASKNGIVFVDPRKIRFSPTSNVPGSTMVGDVAAVFKIACRLKR
jgi:hypothetical protein